MSNVHRFYVYGITVNDVVKYVGKGSETDRQDRVLQYFTHDLKHVSRKSNQWAHKFWAYQQLIDLHQ